MLKDKEWLSGASALFQAPRTILGFFLVFLAIISIAGIVALKVLVPLPDMHKLIPQILIFLGVAYGVSFLSILLTSWIKPERLMLGEIRGEIYLKMLKMRQGDSLSGEIIEDVVITQHQQPQHEVIPSSVLSEKEDDANA